MTRLRAGSHEVPKVWLDTASRIRKVGLAVCAIDPGETTGVCVLRGDEFYTCEITHGSVERFPDQLKEVLIGQEICEILMDLNVGSLVVEDFVLRMPAKSSGRAGLSAARVTACMLTAMSFVDWKGGIWSQGSGQAAVLSGDRLRSLGLWVAGSEHIRDAVRHLEIWRRGGKKPDMSW